MAGVIAWPAAASAHFSPLTVGVVVGMGLLLVLCSGLISGRTQGPCGCWGSTPGRPRAKQTPSFMCCRSSPGPCPLLKNFRSVGPRSTLMTSALPDLSEKGHSLRSWVWSAVGEWRGRRIPPRNSPRDLGCPCVPPQPLLWTGSGSGSVHYLLLGAGVAAGPLGLSRDAAKPVPAPSRAASPFPHHILPFPATTSWETRQPPAPRQERATSHISGIRGDGQGGPPHSRAT